MSVYLDFEQPIADLAAKVRELQHVSGDGVVNVAKEITRLEAKIGKLLTEIYRKLEPWQKVQVARHPDRPHFRSYCQALLSDYEELAGDRGFGDDQAILGGLARFQGQAVVVMGSEKGHDVETRLRHNFGMAKPEGYRKAIRLMELAGQFNLPIISFVDTPGAYPGVGAEERGQAEAIARSIAACLKAPVPFLSIIVGEGGSGGAIALAAADRVAMLEHSIYSVISPEGCASILWRDATDKAKVAAQVLRLTADDLKNLSVIDMIIPEPAGGAHRQAESVFQSCANWIGLQIQELSAKEAPELLQARQQKYLKLGRPLILP